MFLTSFLLWQGVAATEPTSASETGVFIVKIVILTGKSAADHCDTWIVLASKKLLKEHSVSTSIHTLVKVTRMFYNRIDT